MPRPRKAIRQNSEVSRTARVVSIARPVEDVGSDIATQACMTTGTLVHLGSDGLAWIALSAQESVLSLRCLNAASLSTSDLHRQVVLWHVPDGVSIVLAKVAPPPAVVATPPADVAPHEVTIDGRRVVLEAADEIVLRCGRASIVLRRNGRVQIKGAYVETSSEGVNRIKGGTVQIN